MITDNINKNKLFMGIDGGGTKCRAIIVNESNDVLGMGIAGPGNPLHGFAQATASIEQSARLALQDAGLADISLSEITAGIGLAGVNLPSLLTQMNQWHSPFKKMYLTTDLLIACMGAHQGEDGAVIIAGTGSCGFSYVNGHAFMLGGHGFPHGDKGSGAWVGFVACQHALMELDKLVPSSLLTTQVLAHLKVSNAVQLVELIANKPAAYFAQLAACVFKSAQQNDAAAIDIIKDGANYISDIARELLKQNPPRISFIGGLSESITTWLDSDIKSKLAAPLSAPEMGAVLYAKQQINNTRQE